MNSYQTLNAKLDIDEPLKYIQVIGFLFFSFVLGLRDITAAGQDASYNNYCKMRQISWLLGYLPAIALKATA